MMVRARTAHVCNLLEPPQLIAHFLAHPPEGFRAWSLPDGTPAFSAPLDPLLAADDAIKRAVDALPGARHWRRRLRLRTCFNGTTVSEYAVLGDGDVDALVRRLVDRRAAELGSHALLVVKDLPAASPLLDATANAYASRLAEALRAAGFVLIEGQALAWVPVDFGSTDEFLSRLSSGRRKDIRRKLRSRAALTVDMLPTGDSRWHDRGLREAVYSLYRNVYAQSETQFDRLSQAFFDAVLQDSAVDGRVFLYRHDGRLIAFNLCVVSRGALVDKWIGFQYPDAREHNLYCVSWMHNLEYAVASGLSTFVAGWTDPQIKAQLGARFTFTRHAVHSRHALLRAVIARAAGRFEADRQRLGDHAGATDRA
jgi:predicted N-acyltransferase